MKLKSFDKVNTSTKTEFIVFQDNDTKVDRFILDYCDSDIERTNKAILCKLDLIKRGAVVRYVDYNIIIGAMSVTVVI